MARMIDGDVVTERLRSLLESPHGENVYNSGYDDAIWHVLDVIEHMPTLTPPNEPLSVLVNDEPDREYIDYICPRCKDIISQRRRGQRMETVYQCKFHDNCGQRVDWSDPRPYRRPPEREEDT